MRQRFEEKLSLGVIPISEVKIRTKSRDEMPPILVCLQTIFVTKELNESLFELLEAVKLYLSTAKEIEVKLKNACVECQDEELKKYTDYVSLFINQIDRRLLKGDTIAAEEKVYSIFEEYTEWVSKGNRNPELGNLLMIATNQQHLIIDYKIMFKERDVQQVDFKSYYKEMVLF